MRDLTPCNGCTNYPTWSVWLWLEENESNYRMSVNWTYTALDFALGETMEEIAENARGDLAAMIDCYLEENNPLYNSESNMFTDLLAYSLEQVDVMQIAEKLIDGNFEDWREYNV